MKRNYIATARTLSEALPYLQRYDGAIVVVKIGGHAMNSQKIVANFARDIVLMRQVGINCVVIHGGGPKINETLHLLGIKSRFINGRRVSDAATVEIVEMVLSGHINKAIVQAINQEGGRAIGISGKDANLLVCNQAEEELGLVGIPAIVNDTVLKTLFSNGLIPVVAPIGISRNGETVNVNGDTAAGAIASSLNADRMLLLTDVNGVLDSSGEIIPHLNSQQISEMTHAGLIRGGMVPKTETAVEAISKGVRAVVILNGKTPNAVLLELFTNQGIGTLISDKDPGFERN